MGINPEEWELNSKGKSLAYFSRRESVSIGENIIDELEKVSEEKGKVNIRLCLQNSPDESLQDMVTLIYKNQTCKRPHKHKGKEAIHLMKGKLEILVFDEKLELIEKKELDTKGDFMYRGEKNKYHIYVPLTDYALFREIREGTNKPGETSFFEGEFVKAIKNYLSPKNLICSNSSCQNPCPLLKKI